MKLFNQGRMFFVVLTAVLLASCAENKVILNSWVDKAYDNTTLNKVLVVSGLQSSGDDRLLQDALVAQLRAGGVDAVAEHKVFKGSRHPTKEQIMAYAIQNHFDSVLVTRITGENSGAVFQLTPHYGSPYPYYSYWDTYYPHLYDRPGFAAKYKFYYLESNIYAVTNKELVWTTVSQPMDPRNMTGKIEAFAGDIISAIKRNGLM